MKQICHTPARTWMWWALLCSLTLLTLTFHSLHAEINPLRQKAEWRILEPYQDTITLKSFRERLKIFSPHGEIFDYLEVHGSDSATLFDDSQKTKKLWTFQFLPSDDLKSERQTYSPSLIATLHRATRDQPLRGLRIAIDPGHIGGSWANIEERYFKIASFPPVKEGDLTLLTCQHLANALQQAGAETFLTHTTNNPVTSLRPRDFHHDAIEWAVDTGKYFTRRRYTFLTQWYSELLFYRVAEIYARARLLKAWKPDFTICLHYNAAPWHGRRARLYQVQKLVAFVHGSYLPEELKSPTQKQALFLKLFEHSSPDEIRLADAITCQLAASMKMDPEDYSSWESSDRVTHNPYIWSRNVVANRIFPGPVVFIEGPYMNDRETFYRIQAGDYEGEKYIRGKNQPSLFRQFSGAIAEGLIKHYRASLPLP